MRRRYARLVPTIDMAVLQTPIGPLTLAVRDGRVCTLHFEDRRRPLSAGFARKDPSVTIRETSRSRRFRAHVALVLQGRD